jgi:hypothetical protein
MATAGSHFGEGREHGSSCLSLVTGFARGIVPVMADARPSTHYIPEDREKTGTRRRRQAERASGFSKGAGAPSFFRVGFRKKEFFFGLPWNVVDNKGPQMRKMRRMRLRWNVYEIK